jgi:DNA topoisomerase-1
LIDKLALRVGNEKGEDEADTVGCCSLRVEHIRFEAENNITLDFLGKDSMRYLNTIPVEPIVYKLLQSFTAGKK